MKKKAIEKIAFMKLPRIKRKRTVEYVALTGIESISKEPHLLVEVYRNRKECKEIPVVRIAITEKDFGTYFPESGTWSRGRITGNTWSVWGLIWREHDEQILKDQRTLAVENILYSQEDLKRLQEFLKDINALDKGKWWELIDRKQKDIIRREGARTSSRRQERRQQALREREDRTPELTEQRILQYADDALFYNKHYLYYKKHGPKATVACSKCGGVMEARWKPGMSYESRFERMIEEPRMGTYGTCPMCKVRGEYIAQGRAKNFDGEYEYLFLGQKYKEEGMVFRCIEVGKEWQIEQTCGEKEMEIAGAFERLADVEIARVYFEPGKKLQRDYQKHDSWSGKDFWDDCNLSGMRKIRIQAGRIMPETYENMKGTFLQYSAMKEYQEAAGDFDPIDYLERYIQTPQIEMLVKLGFIQVVKELIQCHYGIVADPDAKRADLFLGIYKERVKQLIRYQGEIDLLKAMQLEKRMKQYWTEEQLEQLAELSLDYQVTTALEHMGIQKFLNQVSRYAGCEYGTMCSTASARLRQAAQTYIDYLSMRKVLGYDLHNTVYLFPRSLKAAHDKMVIEHNREEAEKRIQLVKEKYPLIKKHYRMLRKKFYFEDEEFLIRPARDAGEIVMEGRLLHHCVGGDDYLEKHNNGQSTILFLRFKEEPEIPYITVEIGTESLNIRQWYGEKDKKPDEARMKKWLDAYVTRLKCTGMAAGQIGAEETEQRILCYA